MKRVLVSDALSAEGIAILEEAEGIEADVKTGMSPEELKAAIAPYDAIVIRSSTKLTADVIEAAESLRAIGRAGIGVDNIDVEAATKKGVIVMNTPGGNTVTTAEHALSLMMSLVRNIPQASMSMKGGKWEKKRFQGRELRGKTLGVVGLGNIGSIVADRALGLKMKVLAYDPFISKERAAEVGVELKDLDELLGSSDIVTVHIPKLEETHNLVGAEALAKMKPGAYLVCAARGGIVDEEALLEALDSERLRGAALDVFFKEPPGLTPLIEHERVICTPHLGASTQEAQSAVAVQVAEQIVDYLNHGTIRNALNVPSVSPEALDQMLPYLDLARSLGRLQGQLDIEGLRAMELELSGKAAEGRTDLVVAAALEGLLATSLGERVNMVNAPFLARERGIRVGKTTQPSGKDYSSLVRLRVETARGSAELAGAIFGQREPRIVEIDGIRIEAVPKGHLLVFWNKDQPGFVGGVGTILGRHDINIGQMHIGRKEAGTRAVTVVNVDNPVDETLLRKLQAAPQVLSVTKVSL